MSLHFFRTQAFCSLIITLFCQGVYAIDDFTVLGDLAGGGFDSAANGVSADGSVVVGRGTSAGGLEAFRWSTADGMDGLGDLAGGFFGSEARGVSADGSVIAGWGTSGLFIEAFRWTAAGGMVGLGDLAGGSFHSAANGVSADGNVVAGFGTSASGTEAFRWTQATGMVGLGDLPGGAFSSQAYGVNGDGNVIVGASTSVSGQEAFRWSQVGGMVGLGDLPGGAFSSAAFAVNHQGNVVVGMSTSANGDEAFRWTQRDGMVPLGDLAGGAFASRALSVSADGNVIVGQGTSATGQEAFRWTPGTGMQTVVDWLGGAGVPVSGISLTRANGVNADGTVIVGEGISASGNEAWVARVGYVPPPATVPEPVSGIITINDLRNSLTTVGGVMNAGKYINSLPFFGAHHRPLLSYHGLTSGRCVWVSGDLAEYGHQEDGDAGLVELGGCFDPVPGRLRLGAGLGKIYMDQDLAFSGESDLDGEFVVAEADYAVSGLPLLVSVTGLFGDSEADITRGYRNAGALDASFGETDVTAWALRGRMDWVNAFQFSSIQFTPHLSYTASRVTVDDYTETGGSFPAQFNSRDLTSHEMRYGIDGDFQVTGMTWIRGMVEGVHRFDDKEPVLSGQVLGLFPFALPGRNNDTDWIRFGAEVEHLVSPSFQVSILAHGSTDGEDPVVSGGVSFKYSF